MSDKDGRQRDSGPTYSPVQRRLHWLVTLLVLIQFLLQSPMRDAISAIEHSASLTAVQFLVTSIHSWGGTAIGLLVIYRWQLRKERRIGADAAGLSPQIARIAGFHHVLMYLVLLLMAVTGALNYYVGWPVAAQWHERGKWGLLALVAAHILAALWHHLWLRDNVLLRMLGR